MNEPDSIFEGQIRLPAFQLMALYGAIQFADQFSGRTFDQKINAAIAALGRLRGIVDARGLMQGCAPSSPCGTIAGTITIPAQVTLLWPQSSAWTRCTITDGTPCISMAGSSSLVCQGIGANFCNIKVAPGASISAIIQTGNQDTAVENVYVEGIQLTQDARATISHALLDVISTYDSVFNRITVTNIYKNVSNTNRSVWIHDFDSSVGDNAIDFFQPYIQGSVWITSNHGAGVNMIKFFGGDIQHRIGITNGTPGNNLIHIDGMNHTGAVNGIYFYGTYFEMGPADLDLTTPQFTINDAANVGWFGGQHNFNRGYAPGGSSGALKISESRGNCQIRNCTFGIQLHNFLFAGLANGENAIFNDVNHAFNLAGGVNATYLYPNGFDAAVVGLKGPIISLEVKAPPGGASFDELWADTTAHRWKMNNNNGGTDVVVGAATTDTFTNKSTSAGPVTGTVASGTVRMTTSAISPGACGRTVTVAAAGVTAMDTISWAFNASPGTNPGLLTVTFWPTTGNVNFAYCNTGSSSTTPAATTLNWRVLR